jgi:hypothetical protein
LQLMNNQRIYNRTPSNLSLHKSNNNSRNASRDFQAEFPIDYSVHGSSNPDSSQLSSTLQNPSSRQSSGPPLPHFTIKRSHSQENYSTNNSEFEAESDVSELPSRSISLEVTSKTSGTSNHIIIEDYMSLFSHQYKGQYNPQN